MAPSVTGSARLLLSRPADRHCTCPESSLALCAARGPHLPRVPFDGYRRWSALRPRLSCPVRCQTAYRLAALRAARRPHRAERSRVLSLAEVPRADEGEPSAAGVSGRRVPSRTAKGLEALFELPALQEEPVA